MCLSSSQNPSDHPPVPDDSSAALCRYGDKCSRADCKYRHEAKSEEAGPAEGGAGTKASTPEEEYPYGTWLPFQLRVRVNSSSGAIDVAECMYEHGEEPAARRKAGDDTASSAPANPGAIFHGGAGAASAGDDVEEMYYDLMAVVHHIRDARSNGNLVAHIKVVGG